MKNIILHIPHSSSYIPKEVRDQFILSDSELQKEIELMTDWYTDEIFDLPDCKKVKFPVSRLVVDPERFQDDNLEPMAKLGMGVMYTHTNDGKKLRRKLSMKEKKNLINTYYIPHHKRLTIAVENMLVRFGECLIIDCHSFPKVPLPYETDLLRPDICIGTDKFHTPGEMTIEIKKHFERKGLNVVINRPFSGALVPMKFYSKNKRVKSVMIEINRGLYL
jgi:N-formylglutamate deformylase